jgi:hypothetical protein
MIKKTLFMLCLGVSAIVFSEEKIINNLSEAPNPFKQHTNITFKADAKSMSIFQIKNVLGKTVFKKYLNTKIDKNSIPFSKNDLVAGMYIYRIQK